jgi:hypothetical protein
MVKRCFPDYHEDKGQIVPQGWYVWTRKHSSKLYFHIFLVIDPKRDQFTTEAAWDYDGKISHSLAVISTPGEAMAKPTHFRTDILWCTNSFGHWWNLLSRPRDFLNEEPVEDCLPRIKVAVEEAGQKLKEHLVPLFTAIAEKHR